jgi:hypothetical protein
LTAGKISLAMLLTPALVLLLKTGSFPKLFRTAAESFFHRVFLVHLLLFIP